MRNNTNIHNSSDSFLTPETTLEHLQAEMPIALIPEGLNDKLPPVAHHETELQYRLLSYFDQHGYHQVNPPLLEYIETLNAGPGEITNEQCFRVIDPSNQRIMVLSADLTAGVARIAASHFSKQARPLRLAYCGNALRIRSTNLRPERQFIQAGVELIGDQSWLSEREIILLALESLKHLDIANPGLELALPIIMHTLIASSKLKKHVCTQIYQAMQLRDPDALPKTDMPNDLYRNLKIILKAKGQWQIARMHLDQLNLMNPDLEKTLSDFLQLGDNLITLKPNTMFSVDLAETQGFAYKTGIAFTLLACTQARVLGRGGRYITRSDGEAAVGFSIYLDTLLTLTEHCKTRKRILASNGSSPAVADWRAKDYIVIDSLLESDNITDNSLKELAIAHHCTYVLKDEVLIPLTQLP